MTRRDPRGGIDGLMRAGRRSAVTALRGGELAGAAGAVIAARTAQGLQALAGPTAADTAELARLVPEKTAAFGAAWLAGLRGAGALGAAVAAAAQAETVAATEAATRLALCRTPAAAWAVQSGWWTGCVTRVLAAPVRAATVLAHSQAAMLAPVHRAATGNARRLARRPALRPAR